MSTRHLVDPELLLLADFPRMKLSLETLEQARAESLTRFDFLPEPELAGVRMHAPGRDGAPEVPLLVFTPPDDGPRGAILHFHGGGMVLGSAWSFRRGLSAMALKTGAVVVSADYRHGPETVFPGPQEDGYAALKWLVGQGEALGFDPTRIVLTGESAGGGMAAMVALMARDRGGPAAAGQVLVYPMLDHRTGGPDCQWRNPTTGEFLWQAELNRFGWGAIRGDYACDDERVGWFSPARAADLSGLPPCWIGTGSLDLFFDENLDYARRLCAAGVSVELHSWAGAIHGFNALPEARVSQEFAQAHINVLKRMTSVAPAAG